MKKTSVAKLTLHKESLRRLEQGILEEIEGGAPKSHQATGGCITCLSCYRTCTC